VIGARSETLTPAAPKTPDMRNLRLLPPLEYDHPFKGAVELVRMKTQAEVRAACPPNAWTHALACNYYYGLTPPKCKIILLEDAEILKATGLPVSVVWRHEIAHCNGWPAHHPNAHTMDEEAKAKQNAANHPGALLADAIIRAFGETKP